MDPADQNQTERYSARDGTKTRSGRVSKPLVNRTVRNTYPKKGDVVVCTVYFIVICVLYICYVTYVICGLLHHL